MFAVAILAAGKGTRMVSSLPKVLHELAGKTLISRVLDSCSKLNPEKIFVITGHKSELIKKSLSNHRNKNNIHFVLQEPQNGTGHAIQVLSEKLTDFKGTLLILNGDVPLIKPETLKRLIELHDLEKADASLITTKKDEPFGYGRVFIKDKLIEKIVEEKDCNEEDVQNKLINAGVYCFNWSNLSKIINNLKSNNKQKELYLTDAIALLNKSISLEINDDQELQGINNRIQLARCEEFLQTRIKEKHMLNGVTIKNPASCTISEDTLIGVDVIIEANSHIRGKSEIADNCMIGPNTIIENTFIKKNTKVISSTILDSEIMQNTNIGPYSHIRPGCKILSNSKIGNFVEIKNSQLDEFVKVSHLSYIGDSNIGKSTNIGAGTITANFDGIRKHKTEIGENCSIGANTVFIAPVNIQDSVTTGAGSVINKNVNNNSLAISRTKQINIDNWNKKN